MHDPAPPRSAFSKRLPVLLGLAAAYFVVGRLGLMLAFVNPSATAVWPPTGIALAALLLLGADVWPSVFVGAFLVNLATAGGVVTSLAIATGNTLEALVGAYLVTRFANGRRALEHTEDVIKFAAVAAMLSTVVSATLGVATLAAGGLAHRHELAPIWATWWLGDAAGDIVVAPAILLWAARPRIGWRRSEAIEVTALLATLVLASLVVFDGLAPARAVNYPLEFLCTPIVLWIAYRFGQRETASAVVVLSAVAIWGTLHARGPFGRHSPDMSLLLLQAYIGVTAVTGYVLASLASERRQVERQLRNLAAEDPLTGLGNYRRLGDVLHAELQRSGRSGRPVALLFLDLDSLKEINDRFGHVAGNDAIRRVATAIGASCRATDTAARYGGDEFAVVLPETTEATARQIGMRIARSVGADLREPRITVSIGLAIYPRDGDTTEALFNAADRLVYAVKAGRNP